MVGSRSVPAGPVFELSGDPPFDFEPYQWAQHLADSGCWVYVMEFQGLAGKRPAVMDDVFNADRNDMSKLYPSGTKAPPLDVRPYPYPYHLTDANSEIAELWSVLHYISTVEERVATHIVHPKGPIQIVGYSAAAFIVGRSAMVWPEMVGSLFLLAPIFPPWGLSDDLANPPAALFGFPFKLLTRKENEGAWDNDKKIGAERDAKVEEQAWTNIAGGRRHRKHVGPARGRCGSVPDATVVGMERANGERRQQEPRQEGAGVHRVRNLRHPGDLAGARQ